MQVVIDIPKEDWEFIKESDGCRWSRAIIEGVINGTPLPKGHGRLIDANILAKRMIEYGWKHIDSTVHEFVEDAPTIIEADKEEKK